MTCLIYNKMSSVTLPLSGLLKSTQQNSMENGLDSKSHLQYCLDYTAR